MNDDVDDDDDDKIVINDDNSDNKSMMPIKRILIITTMIIIVVEYPSSVPQKELYPCNSMPEPYIYHPIQPNVNQHPVMALKPETDWAKAMECWKHVENEWTYQALLSMKCRATFILNTK